MKKLVQENFTADSQGLSSFLAWLEQWLQKNLLPDEASRALLASEEAAANIVSYAYPDRQGLSYNFTASLWQKEEFLVLVLEDEGVPFNPLQDISANPAASLDKRLPGGWGRVFLKKFTALSEYEFKAGKNILRLYFKGVAS